MLFPRNRRGKKRDVSAIYRYMQAGCRGVVLESLRTPRLVTSRQAVARFIRRLSQLDNVHVSNCSIASARERENRLIEQELDRIGI